MKLLSALHIRMAEYKFSGALESKAKRLEEFEEAIGRLEEITGSEGRITITFNNDMKIILPLNPQLKEKLEEKIGKRIGLLRTDGEKPYLVRDVEVVK